MRNGSAHQAANSVKGIDMTATWNSKSNPTRTVPNPRNRMAHGREVCARRASQLRKKGVHVEYYGRTKNGKARYIWDVCDTFADCEE